MFDSRGRSVDPRFGVNVPRSDGGRTEPAKRFRFAITWTSLTAHLELRDAAELMSAAAGKSPQGVKQSSLAALAGVAAPPRIQRPETQSDSSARWEMVVPKMVRADRVSPALTNAAPFADHRNGDVYPPISIPTFASAGNPLSPLLSRTLAVIGRRTRSLLAGPAKPVEIAPFWSRLDATQLTIANGRASRLQVLQLNAPSSPIPAKNQVVKNEDIKDRRAVRELLLSKIISTLRSHSRSVNSTFESGGAVVEGSDKERTRESVLL
jgi:hypothetical protein